jgi:ABC-type multidrug transport system fused ATPase/permease subunit
LAPRPIAPDGVAVKTWRTLSGLLLPRERRSAWLLMMLMLLQALIETAGVASVLPLLAVLGSPDAIAGNRVLQRAFVLVSPASTQQFVLYLGAACFCFILIGAVVRVATEYAGARFVEMCRHSMSSRLLARYLRQPYVNVLQRNSADSSRTMLSEVDNIVLGVLQPALRIPVYGFIALGLVALLVFTDPVAACIAGLVIGGAYVALYAAVYGSIRRRGESRNAANSLRHTTSTEALGGIKAIKQLGCENEYLRRFDAPSLRFSREMAFVRVVSTVPRYAVEVIAIGGILALTLGRVATGTEFAQIVPLLGLYAFAGYRLLPAVQYVYSGLTSLRFGLTSAQSVLLDLDPVDAGAMADVSTPAVRETSDRSHRLTREIEFRGVSFRYPGAAHDAIAGLTLRIPAGRVTAIVGETGAGKSTAIDLLLGLLTPTAGEIAIDGVPLTEACVGAWQRSVGYVPQQVFLTADSMLANIAFGVPPEARDLAAAERAARLARLHDTIAALPDGYATAVGERGVRLSGGERQRLGLARALYSDPDVLVLDEPTAGLDAEVERQVLDGVFALAPRKTIVLVAHGPNAIAGASAIIRLERVRLAS